MALVAVTTRGFMNIFRNGIVPGMMIQVVVKSQFGATKSPVAVVDDVKFVVKFACTCMAVVVMPVTPPLMLCAPTPAIVPLMVLSKKLLVHATVLVPINAPVVEAASSLVAPTSPVA